MSAHTSGPWAIIESTCALPATETQPASQHYTALIGPIGRGSVVVMQDSSHCSAPFGIGADECRANARLISASPDLLAALIELASGHSMLGEEMALAAIAKATGGGK